MPPTKQEIESLTPIEHIKIRPDMFIGTVKPGPIEDYVLSKDGAMELTQLTIPEALLKIFDEILVNAMDHTHRLRAIKSKWPAKAISVDIDRKSGEITIINTGQGLTVDMDAKSGKHQIELAFGQMMAGSNFGKIAACIGGQNGIGSAATNAFSDSFYVETIDPVQQKKYTQLFEDRLTVIGKPKITSFKSYPYTKVVFIPAFVAFHQKSMTPDVYAMFTRRVYDAGALAGLPVKFNGTLLTANTFKKYAALFVDEGAASFYYESPDWQVVIANNDSGEFRQHSFVNGIHTRDGGKHVDLVVKLAMDKFLEKAAKKRGGGMRELPAKKLKQSLFVMVSTFLTEPKFNSQSKVQLTTGLKDFSSRPDAPSDAQVEKMFKFESIIDAATGNQAAQDKKVLTSTTISSRDTFSDIRREYQGAY